MFKMRTSSMIASMAAMVVAGSAMAATVDTNGGASWSGWTATGVSNELGTWGSGATGGAVYRIYQTVFTFNNNAMSLGSGYSGQGFAGGYGFTNGNTIYGLGIERVSGSGNLGTLTIGFDLGNDSYQAASSVGGTDGRVSTSSWSQYQDFNVQFGASGASQYGVQTGNGSSYGGVSTFVNSGNGSNPGGANGFAFKGAGNGLNYQMFFDITYMNANYTLAGVGSAPTIGNIGDFFRLSIDVGMGSSSAARTAVGSLQVPAPGAIALLGVAGLTGRRRRN
jgi:MYXO-CTERM domain-containing protein